MDLSEASSSETLRSPKSPEPSNMTNDPPKENPEQKSDHSEDALNSEATPISEAAPESETVPHSEATPPSENESPVSPDPTYDDEVSSSTGNIVAENIIEEPTENPNQRHGSAIALEKRNPQSQAEISKIYPGLMNLLSRSDDSKQIEDDNVSRVGGIPSPVSPLSQGHNADNTQGAQSKSGVDILVMYDRWIHKDKDEIRLSKSDEETRKFLKRKFPGGLMYPHRSLYLNSENNITGQTLSTCSSFLDKSCSPKTSMDKPDCTSSDIECLNEEERTPNKLTKTELDQTGNGLVSKSHQSAIKTENISDSKKAETQSPITSKDIFDISNSSDEDK